MAEARVDIGYLSSQWEPFHIGGKAHLAFARNQALFYVIQSWLGLASAEASGSRLVYAICLRKPVCCADLARLNRSTRKIEMDGVLLSHARFAFQ